ncbi:MAG: DUF4126 domain-containing protein [Candidatus Eremiobacteraeota bacterium]|nr:DUF4126 domain-containing protein [Candidatus Eremiobacteraeota bacterium]
MTMDASGQFALAYALTTTAGLRGFLTLLAASLAAHYGWIHPAASFAWLGATSTMVVLALFTVIEFGADKVPAIDHALHAVSFAARPLAAAILVGGTVHTHNSAELYGLMGLGALNALVVHASSASARAASTVGTLGAANPVISFAEDGLSIGGIILAFLHPLTAALLALLFVVGLLFLGRWFVLRVRGRSPGATPS